MKRVKFADNLSFKNYKKQYFVQEHGYNDIFAVLQFLLD